MILEYANEIFLTEKNIMFYGSSTVGRTYISLDNGFIIANYPEQNYYGIILNLANIFSTEFQGYKPLQYVNFSHLILDFRNFEFDLDKNSVKNCIFKNCYVKGFNEEIFENCVFEGCTFYSYQIDILEYKNKNKLINCKQEH